MIVSGVLSVQELNWEGGGACRGLAFCYTHDTLRMSCGNIIDIDNTIFSQPETFAEHKYALSAQEQLPCYTKEVTQSYGYTT